MNEYLQKIIDDAISFYLNDKLKTKEAYGLDSYWYLNCTRELNQFVFLKETLEGDNKLSEQQKKLLSRIIAARKNDLRHKLYSTLINGTTWVVNPSVDKAAIKEEVISLNEVIKEYGL